MADPVTLLLISGSLRRGSTNTALLRTACDVAPAGVETVLYAGIAELPHFNPDDDAEGMPVHPAVASLRAHDSLRKVLGYVHAEIVEQASARIPVPRAAVGADGLIGDADIRAQAAAVLATLAAYVAERSVAD